VKSDLFIGVTAAGSEAPVFICTWDFLARIRVAHPTAEAKADQVPKSIGEYIVSKPEKIKQRKAKCAYACKQSARCMHTQFHEATIRSEDNESRSYASILQLHVQGGNKPARLEAAWISRPHLHRASTSVGKSTLRQVQQIEDSSYPDRSGQRREDSRTASAGKPPRFSSRTVGGSTPASSLRA
jgi:hypothetical protein